MALVVTLEEFVLRVLRATAFDACDDIWWRTDAEYAPVTFLVNCSDFFEYASADCEPIGLGDIELFEKSYADSLALTGQQHSGGLLYCARKRKQRPMPAAYKYIDERVRHLFDECGGER